MGADTAWTHTSVLLPEAIDALAIKPSGVYLDGTFGRGGHARAVLAQLGPQGRLIALDKDLAAVAHAKQTFNDPRFTALHADFAQMASCLHAQGVSSVDGVLLDLGVSSPQLDDASRGFSFRFDAPLDMRMDTTQGDSAADFLATADLQLITQVVRDYGEERFAGAVAKAVVARRESGRAIRSTRDLAELVAGAVKTREPGKDPATRTFQALRIHVNGELEALAQGLEAALMLLAPEGRLAVISFHSLEDRVVKQFIARESKAVFDRRAPFAAPPVLKLKSIGRVMPSDAEVQANPRARSAVLRVAERMPAVDGTGASA
jgi:16S rRNA (cytosine1402-N4)-methyltransferase